MPISFSSQLADAVCEVHTSFTTTFGLGHSYSDRANHSVDSHSDVRTPSARIFAFWDSSQRGVSAGGKETLERAASFFKGRTYDDQL